MMQESEWMLCYAHQALRSQLPTVMHNAMVLMSSSGDAYAKKYCSIKEYMTPTPQKRRTTKGPSRKKAISSKP
jgi:hypothetical protein